jgi:hypothetical protein
VTHEAYMRGIDEVAKIAADSAVDVHGPELPDATAAFEVVCDLLSQSQRGCSEAMYAVIVGSMPREFVAAYERHCRARLAKEHHEVSKQ